MSSVVPEDWMNVSVSEVFYLGRGRVISKDEIRDNVGQYPVFSSQSTNNGEMGRINSYDFEGEYVTWTTDGAYAGTVFYRNGRFNCTNVCGTLSDKGVYQVNMTFAAEYLSTVAKNHVSYVGNPKLMNGTFGEIDLLLPPLPEQKKIASILTSVDEVIETTQKQIDKLQDLKKATMNELLTKGIGHTEFKDSELGRIPKSWEVTEFKNTTEVINGRAYKLTEWEDSGIPVIRLQNLTQKGGNFYFSNLKLPEKQYCFKDDLLFMWSASFGPYIWWGEKGIFHYHIWKMVPVEERLSKKFLYIYLLQMTNKWKNNSSGMAMQHLTKSGIEEQKIIVPPLEEQKKISKVINSIQTQIEVCKSKLRNHKNLKISLMQDLLTGETRVAV